MKRFTVTGFLAMCPFAVSLTGLAANDLGKILPRDAQVLEVVSCGGATIEKRCGAVDLTVKRTGARIELKGHASRVLDLGVVYDTGSRNFSVPMFGTLAPSPVASADVSKEFPQFVLQTWKTEISAGEMKKLGSISVGEDRESGICLFTGDFGVMNGSSVVLQDRFAFQYDCGAKGSAVSAKTPPGKSFSAKKVSYASFVQDAGARLQRQEFESRPGEGDLTLAEVRSTFEARMPAFDGCFSRWLGDGDAKAIMKAQLMVSKDGNVTDAKVITVDPKLNPSYAECFRKELLTLQFPKAKRSSNLEQVFNFSQKGGVKEKCKDDMMRICF